MNIIIKWGMNSNWYIMSFIYMVMCMSYLINDFVKYFKNEIKELDFRNWMVIL